MSVRSKFALNAKLEQKVILYIEAISTTRDSDLRQIRSVLILQFYICYYEGETALVTQTRSMPLSFIFVDTSQYIKIKSFDN